LYNVHNKKIAVDWNYIQNILPNKTMCKIREPITLDKLNVAINKLAWYKAPEKSGVSSNAIKVLNNKN